jgi:RNA polymerase sigma-70 factor (ECF subfamily)
MALSAVQHQEDLRSFTEIITEHQEAVYRYLLRFTHNPHDAQDLFQDTFLRAHRAYAALPADANVRAWLMRIAINLSKNYARDRQRRRRVLVEPPPEIFSPEEAAAERGTDTEGLMISRETAQTLLTAIDALPFHQRVALVQRQFEGLDYSAIAVHLGCSQDSARAHVYQALRKLRLTLDHAQTTIPDGQRG